MPEQQPLETASRAIAWIAAASALTLSLVMVWLSRYQPIEMDLAMMHYTAFLINEKHLLLYRDIFENNLPGPFFFHALIGKTFGYGAIAIRIIDAVILFLLFWCSWKILSPVSRASAVLAPAFFCMLYFSGGTVAAFQRDYIAIVPIAVALALLCREKSHLQRDAAIIGALCGLACGFKPNFIVVFPALYWILLSNNTGTLIAKIYQTAIPTALSFIALFAVPFIWSLEHADLQELAALYKTYTPLYISTRPDLYHYESGSQQWLDLLSMQAKHLTNVVVFSTPGLLWAWRQQKDQPATLKRLRNIAILTFAIAWHEVIAGKYWFAHLLAPYFFVVLCFSLLLVPASRTATKAEKLLHPVMGIVITSICLILGSAICKTIYNAQYNADNHDIRSKKIARYLQANMRADDKVQSLDGSGDGQGSLLLAGATTATRFVEDIPFYLQPDSPVTQGFRREFLDTMHANPPAFFVYIHNFFHPAGGNRLQEFRELNQFLEQYYDVAELVDGEYTIYKRKPAPDPKPE